MGDYASDVYTDVYSNIFSTIWNSPSRYVIIVIAVFMILYIPGIIIYLNRKKKAANDFITAHPNAAKVFMQANMSGRLLVTGVDEEPPNTFYEKNKQGFFLIPGEVVVEAQFTWTRPGIMHKTVTTTVGPSKIKVTAEAYKQYTMGYDKKSESFTFEEC